MPSIRGIRTSISTTSGRSRPTAAGTSAPSRLADDLDVGLGLEDGPQPAADQRLVVDEQDGDLPE